MALVVVAVGAAVPAGCADTTRATVDAGAGFEVGTPVVPSSDDPATRGLELSRATLNLSGLTQARIEQVGLGSYLVNAVGDCGGCHDSAGGGVLGGGTVFPVDGAGHTVTARNLTPDGKTGMKLSEDQFIAAMTTGADFAVGDGSTERLLVMPWPYMRYMTRADLKAIYAYLRALPAVSNMVAPDAKGDAMAALPPSVLPATYDEGDVVRPLPLTVDVLGEPPPDPDGVLHGLAIRPLADPPDLAAASAADVWALGRGSYLVNAVAACSQCHTNPERGAPRPTAPDAPPKIDTANYLTGGTAFAVPAPLQPFLGATRSMSANLVGATHGFLAKPGVGYATFLALLTSGLHVEDEQLGKVQFPMPTTVYRNMVPDDLAAIWTYLKSIPPATGAADKPTEDAARYCAIPAIPCRAAETCTIASNECVGGPCAADADCGACQACVAGACVAPDVTAACLVTGI